MLLAAPAWWVGRRMVPAQKKNELPVFARHSFSKLIARHVIIYQPVHGILIDIPYHVSAWHLRSPLTLEKSTSACR